MHEPDAPAWATECIRRIRKEQPTMTPEEKKEIAFRLGKEIIAFFKSVPVFTNQDAVEILGIATMYYHSVLYVIGLSEMEEKP